jgi:hypothetical protein
MKKSNEFKLFKEVIHNFFVMLFLAFILVFPFALIWVGMWFEQIFR